MSVSVKWHVGTCEKHTVEEAAANGLCCLSVRDDSGHPVRKTLENLRLIAAAPQLLEACVGVLGSSTHRGQCIFCGARIDEEHAECCPTIPLRKSIRAAREG